ncbi:MAG: hypothetical protein WCN27_04075 [Alphaproteobacteria bacterium]
MLTKNGSFKVFLVAACFMETHVHSAAMAASAVEIDSVVRRKFSRGELQRVVDRDLCLAGFDRNASLVKTYKILKAKLEERSALIDVLSSVEFGKLISDTLSITKMVAWLKVPYGHRISIYNYCINLIKTVGPVEDKRNSALLNANLARILYFKLNLERGGVSYSAFDADQQRRREIYDLYRKAIENRAAKIVLLKAAELIMNHGFSPTGEKAQDLAIAEEMLTDFFNPKSVRSKELERGFLFSPVQKSDGGISRDRRHSLPFAGSSKVKDEAIRLLGLLRSAKEEGQVEEDISAAASLVVLPVSLPLVINGSGNLSDSSVMKSDDGGMSSSSSSSSSASLSASSSSAEHDDSDDMVLSHTKRPSKKKKRRIVNDSDDDDAGVGSNDDVAEDSVSAAEDSDSAAKPANKKKHKKEKRSEKDILKLARALGSRYGCSKVVTQF